MHARAPRARVKISTRIFGLPMVLQQFFVLTISLKSLQKYNTVFFSILTGNKPAVTIQP
jgi:hypothetical protein